METHPQGSGGIEDGADFSIVDLEVVLRRRQDDRLGAALTDLAEPQLHLGAGHQVHLGRVQHQVGHHHDVGRHRRHFLH